MRITLLICSLLLALAGCRGRRPPPAPRTTVIYRTPDGTPISMQTVEIFASQRGESTGDLAGNLRRVNGVKGVEAYQASGRVFVLVDVISGKNDRTALIAAVTAAGYRHERLKVGAPWTRTER